MLICYIISLLDQKFVENWNIYCCKRGFFNEIGSHIFLVKISGKISYHSIKSGGFKRRCRNKFLEVGGSLREKMIRCKCLLFVRTIIIFHNMQVS
jgi:hypothetical protein